MSSKSDRDEIIDLLKKWKEEIVQLNEKYYKSTEKIDKLRKTLESQTKKYETGLPYWARTLGPYVLLIISIVGLLIVMNLMPCGTNIKFPAGVEVSSRDCQIQLSISN